MDEFDFDVNNIISIQPKKRRQENMLNNINSVSKSSFILNKNVEPDAREAANAVESSLLGQVVSNINIVSTDINGDYEMMPLKPEVIALLDLFRLGRGAYSPDEKTVNEFINYSFIYRKYREDLLKEMLNKIYKADKKSDYIKLRQKFKRDLRRTLNRFSFMLRVLINKTASMNDVKARVSALRDDTSMATGYAQDLIASLGLDDGTFKPGADVSDRSRHIIRGGQPELLKPLWTNSMIVHILLLEFKRSLLYTSNLWHETVMRGVESVTRARAGVQDGIGIDVEEGEFVGAYIDWIGQLADQTDEGVHIFAATSGHGHQPRIPTELVEVVSGGPGRYEGWHGDFGSVYGNQVAGRGEAFQFRTFATLAIQELATSKAIRRHIKKTDRSKDEMMVVDEINDMFSLIENNVITHLEGLEIDGNEVSLSVLEYTEADTITDEKVFNYDEMLMHIMKNNDKTSNNYIIKSIRDFRNKFRYYKHHIRLISGYKSVLHDAYIQSLNVIYNKFFNFNAASARGNQKLLNALREARGSTELESAEGGEVNVSTGTSNSNPMGGALDVNLPDVNDHGLVQEPLGQNESNQPSTPRTQEQAINSALNSGGQDALSTMWKDNSEKVLLATVLAKSLRAKKDFLYLALMYTQDFKRTVDGLNVGGVVDKEGGSMKSGLLTSMISDQGNTASNRWLGSGATTDRTEPRLPDPDDGGPIEQHFVDRAPMMKSIETLKKEMLYKFIGQMMAELFVTERRLVASLGTPEVHANQTSRLSIYRQICDGLEDTSQATGLGAAFSGGFLTDTIALKTEGRRHSAGELTLTAIRAHDIFIKLVKYLTGPSGLLQSLANSWHKFSIKGGGRSKWHPYKPSMKQFAFEETNFSGIDRNGMFLIWLESFISLVSETNPFDYVQDVTVDGDVGPDGADVGAHAIFHLKLQDPKFKFARQVLREPLKDRSDFKELIEPLRVQNKEVYNNMKKFINDICNKSINGFIRKGKTFKSIEHSLKMLKEDFEVDLSEILDRGGIDQLTTMNIMLSRIKGYRRRNIHNFDNFVSLNEKNEMIKLLSTPERSLLYGHQSPDLTNLDIDTIEELVRNSAPSPDPAVIPDNEAGMSQEPAVPTFPQAMTPAIAVKSNKILAVGIPIGMRSELNKLIAGKTGVVSVYDPTFSRVTIEVWSRNITESDNFRPIKAVKFNLDYFVNRSSYAILYKKDFSMDDFKVHDKNDPYFRSSRIYNEKDDSDAIDVEEIARREEKLNEIISHLLKVYVKLLYGMNFDESQFFVFRELLDVDFSDSDSKDSAYQNELKAKFNSIVSNITNNSNKIKTGFEVTPSDISRIIAESGNNRIKQFSNKLEKLSDSKALEGILTPNEKKIKLDLEDRAIKVAQTFNYSAEISGGLGFFKRALSPKLFEKIVLIDVPLDKYQSITDLYVTIKMTREGEPKQLF